MRDMRIDFIFYDGELVGFRKYWKGGLFGADVFAGYVWLD